MSSGRANLFDIMNARHHWLLGAALALLLIGALGVVQLDGLRAAANLSQPAQSAHTSDASGPLTPLPTSLLLDARKVALGDRLFHEGRLGADGMVSCSHCHNLSSGGVDRLVRASGIGGQQGSINTPTVFNSGLSFRQFWDGRAETLETQVDGPLQNPIEMGNTWPKAIAMLKSDARYVAEFAAIYPDGIQPANVRDAIATFERSLSTPNSRFDRFLQGNLTALNGQEQAGYRLFKQIGCTSCHQGAAIGGNMYQKLGIMEDYFGLSGKPATSDLGRYNVTKRDEDRHFFKMPSLRNVAVTPPYLHNGSAATLEDAVRVMARYQLGRHLDDPEIASIVAFLRTLTGEYQSKALQ